MRKQSINAAKRRNIHSEEPAVSQGYARHNSVALHLRRAWQADMRIKLFNFELLIFECQKHNAHLDEIADFKSAELAHRLSESPTLLKEVFAQPDLETTELKLDGE